MTTKENVCFMCWVNSSQKPLVKIEIEWRDDYVCTACLPTLIHW